jgi:hypothetical protein
VSPATFRTIWRLLGLSAEEIAPLLGLIEGRSVRRLASGSRPVTADVRRRLLDLEATLRRAVEGATDVAAGHDGPVVTIAYRSLDDMLPEQRPPALAMHDAMLAALRLRLGEQMIVVDFAEDRYRSWLGAREDTQIERGSWAAAMQPSEAG